VKRGLRIGLLAIAALGVACRGIVGIEDLTVSDGGTAPPGSDAGDSGGGGDAGKEGSTTTPPPGPPAPPPPADASGDISSCKGEQGGQCFQCCRQQVGQAWHLLELAGIDAGCICGSAACLSECGGSGELCSANPSGGPPGPACGPCVDPALKSCALGQSKCAGEPSCKLAADCIGACNP
jgi:hypothetical protein